MGSVSSWLRLAYIVYVLHWSTRFLVGSLGHDSFAGRPACLGLQDMTGSTLEVCLCLSLVLLLRLVGLRCPSPNEHLKVFFTADPFLLDAHIDVCTRASDPTISFVQEVALLNCRSPLRFDRLVAFRLVLFDVWTSHFHRHHMSFTPVMWSAAVMKKSVGEYVRQNAFNLSSCNS